MMLLLTSVLTLNLGIDIDFVLSLDLGLHIDMGPR